MDGRSGQPQLIGASPIAGASGKIEVALLKRHSLCALPLDQLSRSRTAALGLSLEGAESVDGRPFQP